MEASELMSKVNLVDFAESCGVELNFKNGEYWGLSPFKPEKTPSFSINEEKQTFYDFSSGKGGNLIEFIKQVKSCSVVEAIKILKSYAGVEDDNSYEAMPLMSKIARRYKPINKENKCITKREILPDTYMDLYEERKEKLDIWASEGMSLEVLKKFEVRYDPYSNRLVYPVRDYSGNIVNVCGRTLDEEFKEKGIRKYTYFKKWGGEMNVVFGYCEHKEEILKKKEIILFEGAKSVFIAETWGYNNGAALLTSHLSDAQFRFLVQLGVNVVFALDEEVDIFKDKNIQKLKHYCSTYYIYNTDKILNSKMSPVDAGYSAWETLYNRRRKLS